MPNAITLIESPRAIPVRKLVEIQCRCDNGEDDTSIGLAVGIVPELVAEIVAREHWRERALTTPEDQKNAQAAETVLAVRFQRAAQARARLLVFAGFDLAGSAADAGDPRGFKDAAQGAKLMHDIAVGTDAGKGNGATGPNLAAFYVVGIGAAPREREEKRVEQGASSEDEF